MIPLWKRGIYELPTEGGEPPTVIYYSHPTIPGAAIIPEPVRKIQAEPGTVISRVEVPEEEGELDPKWAIPSRAGEVLGGKYIWGPKLALDFWTLLFGSAEQKLTAMGGGLPLDPATIDYIIEKGTGNGADWSKEPWITPMIIPPVKAPELPGLGEIGKYAAIAAAAIGGIYLLGRYIGKK